MKKLIIFLAVVLLTVSSMLSQNRIDPPSMREYQTVKINFDDTTIFAKNWNDLIIGWNYGGLGRQFDHLMNSNFYLHSWEIHNTFTQDLQFANRGTNHKWYLTINPLNQAASDGNDRGIVGTQAMYYEPSIDVVTDDSFTPTSNHIEGAVFGFQYKHPNITNTGGKAVINTNVVTSLPVLSDVWPKNELKFWNMFYFYYHNFLMNYDTRSKNIKFC